MTLKSRNKQPIKRGQRITAHPYFPAIVALWCGALLGMAGMAVPTSLIEHAVIALRVDLVVPAASPPLGLTARVLIALAAAGAGTLLGYRLARRIAAAGADAPVARRRSPRDGAGEGFLSVPGDHAAVSDAAPQGHDDNDDLERLAAARAAQVKPRRPLVIAELEAAPIAAPPLPARAPETAPVPAIAAGTPASAAPAVPLQQLGIAELVDRIAAALEARRLRIQAARAQASLPAAAEPESGPESPGADNFAPESVAQELSAPPGPESAAPPEAAVGEAVPVPAPTSTPAALAEPEPEPEPESEPAPEFLPPPALEAFQPEAPLAPPAAFDPGVSAADDWIDEAEEEATLASLLPPKRPTGRPFNFKGPEAERAASEFHAEAALWAPPEPEAEPDEDDLPEEEEAPSTPRRGFTSLLDMRPPVRQPQPLPGCVRVDEGETEADMAEPVVVFPGRAVPPPPVLTRLPGTARPASPVETEEALRDALAALQSMSTVRR